MIRATTWIGSSTANSRFELSATGFCELVDQAVDERLDELAPPALQRGRPEGMRNQVAAAGVVGAIRQRQAPGHHLAERILIVGGQEGVGVP